jgi:SAM-dependent methyltransferase
LTDGFSTPNFTTFDRDCDGVLVAKLKEINLAGKTISQLPCNNGRELLSLMRFGAKEAVGFDISDEAIEEARELADISKMNVKFERTDILEIDDEYNERFDFIYISEGSLQWFPDLNEYFGIVSKLLKKDGEVLIFEMHPLAYMFEEGSRPDDPGADCTVSYFEKGPYHYKKGLDYIGGGKYDAKTCYWFVHKLSDILKALSKNKIELVDFDEFDMELANNAAAIQSGGFPLSYMLKGRKKGP